MQKSQSQQRLDRQQCITGPACQKINRTIFITAHCNFSWQWSEMSQFLRQNCSQLLLSQSSWCLTEPFGKPLSLAAITACPAFHTPPFFQEGKSLSQVVFFSLDFTLSSPAVQMVSPTREAEQELESGSKLEGQGWESPGIKEDSERTPGLSHDATVVVQGK